ncbi:hypothetical protein ACFQJ7_12780 [Halovenus rubra]|uniref:Uncharacterized protein n=2 Tax=Halovenus rubra TaxID=869890 RepID=A0ACC7E084_9EURY|nr:hypothetical protein [Halovenus rubra]
MNYKTDTTEDEPPENQIETVSVSADAIVSAILRNARDMETREDQQSKLGFAASTNIDQ